MPDHLALPAEGWSFHRLDDGSVYVHSPNGHIVLDPDNWATAVAAVSARGETGDTVRNARAFHEMAPRRMETL